MDAFYALTFIPLLLITLVVHEAGHLITATLLKVKVSAFQIGVGKSLFTVYTGRTKIGLTHQTANHSQGNALPSPGDLVHVHVRQLPNGEYSAAAIHDVQPTKKTQYDATDPITVFQPITRLFKRPRPYLHQPNTLSSYNSTHMQLTGRVHNANPSAITLADTAWSLRIIPIMAAVFMPEDPDSRISNAYNTKPWTRKALITAAGPLANLVLLAAVIALLAALPFPTTSNPLIAIDSVAPDSPAHSAGILPGDYIIQMNNILIPTKQELVDTISEAMITGDPITLHIRRGNENETFHITPDPAIGLIGITISEYIPPTPNQSINPDAMAKRFNRLTTVYFSATISLIKSIGDQNNPDPILSSPVMTAYYTAQAVEHAKLRAWLAILAAITLGTAILNLLPIPPLDGYNLLIQTIQAARNRPINPNLERAFIVSGISLIIVATMYLLTADIITLLE